MTITAKKPAASAFAARWIGGIVIAAVAQFAAAEAGLIAPRATQLNMQALPAVGLDDRCFDFDGVIKPAGCNFRPEKSLTVRGVAGDTARLHRLDFRTGILSPLHNHPDEEIFFIVSGKFKVVSGDDAFLLSAGDILMVPAFVPHQFEALMDSTLLEVGGPGPMLGPMRADMPPP